MYIMNGGVQGKCIATPTRTTPFSKEKGAALGGTRTHDTLLTRQSALPTELPGQLSRQGSKSTTQHNTRQSQPPILCAMAQKTMYVRSCCHMNSAEGFALQCSSLDRYCTHILILVTVPLLHVCMYCPRTKLCPALCWKSLFCPPSVNMPLFAVSVNSVPQNVLCNNACSRAG